MQCLEGEGQDQEQQKELPRTAAHPDGPQSVAFRSCLSSSPVAGACGLISPHFCSAASKATGEASSVPLQELGQGPFLTYRTPVVFSLSQPKEAREKPQVFFPELPQGQDTVFYGPVLSLFAFCIFTSTAVCFQAFGMPNDFQSTVYFNPSYLLINQLASKCSGKKGKEVVTSALKKASNCHMITSKQQQADHFVGYIMIQPHRSSSSVSGFFMHVTLQNYPAHQLQG